MYLKKTIFLSFCFYCNFLGCNGCNNNESNDKKLFEVVIDAFRKKNKDCEDIIKILKPVLIVADYLFKEQNSKNNDNTTIKSIIDCISEPNEENMEFMFNSLLNDEDLKLDNNIDDKKTNRILILKKLIERLKTDKECPLNHSIYINDKNIKTPYVTVHIELKDDEDLIASINDFFVKNKYVMMNDFNNRLILDVHLKSKKKIKVKEHNILINSVRKNYVLSYRCKYIMLENGKLFKGSEFKELNDNEIQNIFIISDYSGSSQRNSVLSSHEYQS